MRELTEADRAALKSQWGPELRVVSSVVETDEGDETVTLVVRRPSVDDFETACDAAGNAASRFEGIQNCVTKYAVWPTASELGLVFDSAPTLIDAAWEQVESICGSDSIATLQQGTFASLTPEEKTKAKITDEQIATWSAQDKRRRCVVFRVPTPAGLWICRRPGQSAYASYRRQRDQGKFSAALRELMVECGVFPDEDTRAAEFTKFPSLVFAVGYRLASASEKAKATSGGI